MNQPILQVMIPAYGESPYLRDTLLSAVTNLSKDVGIMVIEDPSDSDEVEKIVQEFSHRVHYLKNANRLGIAGNFNKAIELSNARFTIICGSDDLIVKDISKKLEDFLLRSDLIAIISKTLVINKCGKKTWNLQDIAKSLIGKKYQLDSTINKKDFIKGIMFGYWFYFPGIIWNTSVVKQEKFNTSYSSALDLEFFIRMMEKEYKVYNWKEEIISYRRHSESVSSLLRHNLIRFKEEYACHDLALTHFYNKIDLTTKILIKLAPTIRIHILITFFSSLFKGSENRVELFKLFFRKVRIKT